MSVSFGNHELYELNFDFSHQEKIFRVSAIISPAELRVADTREKVRKAVPYSVQPLVIKEKTKKISEIIDADDDLTKSYGDIVCGIVGLILENQEDIRPYFPEGKFHYKANSLQKITLQ